jgi:hypothetical protein
MEGARVVEQSGRTNARFVAPDGAHGGRRAGRATSARGRDARQTSTANDTVTGDTTLTLVDPRTRTGGGASRSRMSWAKDVARASERVRASSRRRSFPRNGPTDVRILDATGRESVRVPESSAEACASRRRRTGASSRPRSPSATDPRCPSAA